MMRLPLLTKAGIVYELVANPMPKVIAFSTPKNSATSVSNSTCFDVVPGDRHSMYQNLHNLIIQCNTLSHFSHTYGICSNW